MASSNTANEIALILEEIEPALIEIRRRIHALPEIGFETTHTARLVAEELRALGLDAKMGVGRSGVVADIAGAAPGPCLLIRADMDALPIPERTGLPFASTVPGHMHACGHDIHTAMLIGAAKVLVSRAPLLAGSIRLVFQPAEETLESGAAAMISDGAAEGADLCLGFHNDPQIPVGSFGYTVGSANASCDEFDIEVIGQSAHAASPEKAIDPIVTAAAMIMQLQTVVSRTIDPSSSAILTIGQIEGGTTYNIIPGSCVFRGTIRCRSQAARADARSALQRICSCVAAAMGATCKVDYHQGPPALENDGHVLQAVVSAVERQFGGGALIEIPARFYAEDFAFFTQQAPGAHFLIGSSRPGRSDALHSPEYDPDEACIKYGATVLAQAALNLLRNAQSQ